MWLYKKYYKSTNIHSLQHIFFSHLYKIDEWNYFLLFLGLKALSEVKKESIKETIKSMKLYKVHQENYIDLASFGKYILKYIVNIHEYDELCEILDCTFDEFKQINKIDIIYKPHHDWNFCTTNNVRPSDDSLFLNYYVADVMIEHHFDWIYDKKNVFSENLKHWCIKEKIGLMMKTLNKSYSKFEPYLDKETKDLYKKAVLCDDYIFWSTGGRYTGRIYR